MRKLVYWVADRLDDSSAYSIRAATKREVSLTLLDDGCKPKKDADSETVYVLQCESYTISYAKPRKVVVEYDNLVHLIQKALGEGGIE